jgi:hypothetical protein
MTFALIRTQPSLHHALSLDHLHPANTSYAAQGPIVQPLREDNSRSVYEGFRAADIDSQWAYGGTRTEGNSGLGEQERRSIGWLKRKM